MKHRLAVKNEGIFIFSDYKKPSSKILYSLLIVFFLIVSIISIFPPLWLFLSSFKSPDLVLSDHFKLLPDSMDFTMILSVWRQFSFGKYYLNSFLLVAGALVASILFNGLLAYSTSVVKPKGYKVIDMMVISTLMIPAMINISPLYMSIISVFNTLSSWFGTNVWNLPYFSYLPLWLVYGANAYYYVLFKVYFSSLPKSLFEAARVDGANHWQMFTKLLLPMSMPIVMVVAIFTMNAAWSDFLLPSLMTQINQNERPIMVKLYTMYADQMAQVTLQEKLMTIMFSVIPPIVLFALFQKKISSSVSTSGLKE